MLVADKGKDILSGQGTFWDSGKINSSQPATVYYKGKPLSSNHTYYWKVKIWEKQGQTVYSKPAHFTTSILDSQLWLASWIGEGIGQEPVNPEGFYQEGMEVDTKGDSIKYGENSLLIRKEYEFSKPVAKANVHICE